LLALACGDVDSVLPAPQPVVPREAAPTLTAVSPNVGSTVGATPVTLTGTGFESKSVSGVGRTEVVVTLGGNTVMGRVDHRDPRGTVIYLDTPAHAAGPVDVVVTTAHGGSVTLAGGYTYAAPTPSTSTAPGRGGMSSASTWASTSPSATARSPASRATPRHP
jgi:hypothetical protein